MEAQLTRPHALRVAKIIICHQLEIQLYIHVFVDFFNYILAKLKGIGNRFLTNNN
jgi:hypothetical protein